MAPTPATISGSSIIKIRLEEALRKREEELVASRPTLHTLTESANQLSRCGKITLGLLGALFVLFFVLCAIYWVVAWRRERARQLEEEEAVGQELYGYGYGRIATVPQGFVSPFSSYSSYRYQKLEPVMEEDEIEEEEVQREMESDLGVYRI